MQVVSPFISLFALLMHTQQHAWSIRISMHGMLDTYLFVMEKRNYHEEIETWMLQIALHTQLWCW
jgi:hypothetical protein